MVVATLLASAALTLAAGSAFALVGRNVLRAVRPARLKAPHVMFVLFWASAAIVSLAQGLATLAAAFDEDPLALALTLDDVTSPFYCLAAASLVYYALYLRTGRRGLLRPILAYYLVLFFLLRFLVEWAVPVGLEPRAWVVNIVYETPLDRTAYPYVVALLGGPVVASAVSCGLLAFRIHEPLKRKRIALLSIGITAWAVMETAAFMTGFARTDAGEVARRLVALGSAALILHAYRLRRAPLPPAG